MLERSNFKFEEICGGYELAREPLSIYKIKFKGEGRGWETRVSETGDRWNPVF